jgi:hypothetical protein
MTLKLDCAKGDFPLSTDVSLVLIYTWLRFQLTWIQHEINKISPCHLIYVKSCVEIKYKMPWSWWLFVNPISFPRRFSDIRKMNGVSGWIMFWVEIMWKQCWFNPFVPSGFVTEVKHLDLVLIKQTRYMAYSSDMRFSTKLWHSVPQNSGQWPSVATRPHSANLKLSTASLLQLSYIFQPKRWEF